MTYRGMDIQNGELTPEDQKKFNDAVENIKLKIQQTKGAGNAGKIIIPQSPLLEIDVKPLSIPTSSNDTISYDNWVSQKLYSFMDGGSLSAFEGENEYSNNAIVKLKDLYDGTFRMFQNTIINNLQTFMINLFTVLKIQVNLDKIYISIDISQVKIYQDIEKKEILDFTKESILTINEGRQKLTTVSERYADLTDIEQGDKLFIELKNTKDTEDVETSSNVPSTTG